MALNANRNKYYCTHNPTTGLPNPTGGLKKSKIEPAIMNRLNSSKSILTKAWKTTCNNESGKNSSKSILAKLGKRPDQTCSNESGKILQNRSRQSSENEQIKLAATNQAKFFKIDPDKDWETTRSDCGNESAKKLFFKIDPGKTWN
jgi:hypothetical protein